MKIDIIDDFLTDYQHQSLLRTFGFSEGPKLGRSFPWYFNDNLNDEKRLGNYYFTNIVMDGYNILYVQHFLSFYLYFLMHYLP